MSSVSLAQRMSAASSSSSSSSVADVAVDALSNRIVILTDSDLAPSELLALQQQGITKVLNPSDLPPISVTISALLQSVNNQASFLVINLSDATLRHWVELRVDQINALTHVCHRKSGESDRDKWIRPFLPCSVLKQILPAYTLADFVAQLTRYRHIPPPSSQTKQYLSSVFSCLKDNSTEIASAVGVLKNAGAVLM